jgi:SAM-dependent methyltransferase
MNNAWNRDFYKTGYEGYECLTKFQTSQALEDYRRLLLEKTDQQVEFIARHLGERKLRVIEFCSGNGRLLVTLALKGMIDFGIGVEISKSRVAFAQRWIADLGLDHVKIALADGLTFDRCQDHSFDLAICITGAFSYFHPIRENAPAELLGKMRKALTSDGQLLLETYQIPEKRKQMLLLNGGKLRLWQSLPPQDPFAYYLDDFEYSDEEDVLRHGKIFVARDGTIDAGREEVLKYYTDEGLSVLLKQQGFNEIVTYGDFDDAAYHEGLSEAMIVLATPGS